MMLFFYPLLPESPRFLLVRGRTDQALTELNRAARFNRMELPQGTLVLSKTKTDEPPVKKSQNARVLFSAPLLRTTLLMWVIWFANSFVYYGLVLFAPTLYKAEDGEAETAEDSNSIYLDVLITSAAEFPGLILAAIGVDKIGRKKTLGFMFLGCSIAVGLLAAPGGKTYILIFSMCARMFILGTFSSIYVYTQEIYPTSIRSTGLGMCSSVARIAGICTPFVSDVLSDLKLFIPIAIYGGVALIACVASFFLPFETKGRALQEVAPSEKTRLIQNKTANQ